MSKFHVPTKRQPLVLGFQGQKQVRRLRLLNKRRYSISAEIIPRHLHSKTLIRRQSYLCSSSETQGQIVGTRESLNGRKNIYKTKKSKERREEPLGTMSYQTSSKRSPPFWLLIGARKTQPRGSSRRSLLFFVLYIFFRPFRLSLVPTICPWVSEDDLC